ncbi:MAG: hypothetical protein JWL77_4668 [Chthonomonadaceae bacterium]|nr:hypothetical protein [Chthonomonadaceae bacterium]
MRNRVFWNSPHTRLFSCLTLLGLMALALAGCGGGGSNNNNNNNGNTYSLAGTVKDTGSPSAPVVNALVSIVGTNQTTHTDASGHFSFVSVPANSTAFTVGNPNSATYFSYANYGGKLYDLILCTLPLPTLHTGTNAIGEVDVLLGGNNPPPPPLTGGCP